MKYLILMFFSIQILAATQTDFLELRKVFEIQLNDKNKTILRKYNGKSLKDYSNLKIDKKDVRLIRLIDGSIIVINPLAADGGDGGS